MSKDETTMDDLRDMMQIVIEGQNKFEGKLDKFEGKLDKFEGKLDKFEGRLNGVDGKVDKLLIRVISLEDKVDDHTRRLDKIDSDLTDIKAIVEKDAKDQNDHKIEHVSNIAAHDRFERRISKVENKVGVGA